MPAFIPGEYVAWVKRTLNRQLGEFLVTDGVENQAYYDQVNIWKSYQGIEPYDGIVDAKVQNTLIRANHSDGDYGGWVRKTLTAASVARGLGTRGMIDGDPTVKKAIKSYQAYNGMRDDGWVGYYTEMQLLKDAPVEPPGVKRKPTPPPKKPIRPPKKPVDPMIETARLLKVMSRQIYHRTDPGAGVFPDPLQRKRVRCLAWKLANPSGIDFSYFMQRIVLGYCNEGGSNTFVGGKLPNEVADNLRKDLLNWVRMNRHRPYKELVEKYQQALLLKYRDMLMGILQIHAEYAHDGDNKGGAHYIERFLKAHYGRRDTVLYCFRGL